MDTQILSPAPDDHDPGRHSLVVGSGHRFGLFGCLVASEIPPILSGRVANRVANQLWPPVSPRILRNLLFDARGRVHATLFATLMSMLVAVETTTELQAHDEEGAD